jgi:Tol biopolymer transport system component
MKRNSMRLAIAVMAALVVVSGRPIAQSSAEVALRAAMELETVKGDLKGAIEQYRKLAAGPDRPVAARALIRMAECHQKLGSAEARQVYERVLRDFSDQKDAASEARTRLAGMNGSNGAGSSVRTRLLWDNAIDAWGTTSADGRLLSFVDWETGDLAVRDLVSGQHRRVTNKGGYAKAEAEAEASATSPDGRLIAFTWDRWDDKGEVEGYFQLRVIGTDGSNERVLMTGSDIAYLEPQAWSPDGRWIAVLVQRPPHPPRGGEIVLVSPDGTQARTLLKLADQSPFTLRFSPDGRWLAFDLGSVPAGSGAPPRVAVVPTDGMAGAPSDLIPNATVMGWTPDGRGVLFRRAREGDMELYLQPVSNGRAVGDPQKISAVSDIGSALGMTAHGTLIFTRARRPTDAVVTSFDAATGRVGALNVERAVASFGQGATGGGVRFSPDGRYLLFTTAPTTIVIRTIADRSDRTLAIQLARLIRLEWAPDGQSLLASGATREGTLGLFRIDLVTGAAVLLFESARPPRPDLPAPRGIPVFGASPDGRTIYYRLPGGPVLARDLTTGTERKLFEVTGLVSGLVVSRSGSKLALTLSDRLVFVDTQTGATEVRWATNKGFMDRVTGGAWTPDDRFFVTTAALGPSGLRPRRELWTFPVAGGDPLRQALPAEFRGVSMSSDGRQLAMMRWENILQVWALENFLPPAATAAGQAR